MTGRPPHYTIAVPFCLLLVSLNVTPASTEAGLLDKVKGATPSLASVPLIKAIGDYTKGVVEEGTALVKEGMSGNVDAATYNRRADDFLDRKANMGITAFLEDAADNLKLKVSNPLAGLKEKLWDTRLGRAAASVKEKIWATTVESGETSVAKSDKQYGAIDPRIALDINEEETEWYQTETDLMDETSLSVAYLNEEIDSLDNAREGSHWEAQYQDEDGWVDETAVARRADEVQKRDPWTDIDDGADEGNASSGPDCTNAWVDIDAGCGDEYQGDEGQSDETDVAGLSDDAEGGTYLEAMDRLWGDETPLDSDAYSASGGGYEEALFQLEAEAAERERQAQLEAETVERERQAQLEAELAERELQARLEAEAAERKKVEQEKARQRREQEEYYAELEEELRWEAERSRLEANRARTSGFLGQLNDLTNMLQQRSNAAYSAVLQQQARRAEQERLRQERELREQLETQQQARRAEQERLRRERELREQLETQQQARREWEQRREAQRQRAYQQRNRRQNSPPAGGTHNNGCPWGSSSGGTTIC